MKNNYLFVVRGGFISRTNKFQKISVSNLWLRLYLFTYSGLTLRWRKFISWSIASLLSALAYEETSKYHSFKFKNQISVKFINFEYNIKYNQSKIHRGWILFLFYLNAWWCGQHLITIIHMYIFYVFSSWFSWM